MLENIYLCGINNNKSMEVFIYDKLWFAWKYLPLWYQQQLQNLILVANLGCDLLENIYLCGINNNWVDCRHGAWWLWFAWKYLPLWYQQQLFRPAFAPCRVVICLKISTFVVSTTTVKLIEDNEFELWFAWKYLPLWYQQQLIT